MESNESRGYGFRGFSYGTSSESSESISYAPARSYNNATKGKSPRVMQLEQELRNLKEELNGVKEEIKLQGQIDEAKEKIKELRGKNRLP